MPRTARYVPGGYIYHVLNRGVYDQPGQAVTAAVPAAVLGDLHPVTLSQLHHDIEEIHAIQLELIAKCNIFF